jgi:hypothetical protein
MHALRGIAFGYEPVRLKFRQAEKVARCNRRSNPPDLTLIHGREHDGGKSQNNGKRANMRPHENGFS